MSERDERALLRQAMAEASLLPPDDSVRRQLEQDMARSPEWARREWLELLQGDEDLRIELRQLEVPAGLMSKLLLIADTSPDEASRTEALAAREPGGGWPWGLFAGRGLAAASLLALVALLAWFAAPRPDREQDIKLQTLALLATQDHMNEPHLEVKGPDLRQVAEFLSTSLGFPVSFPALGPKHTLLGGRKCRLGSHPVAYTYWQGPGGSESLFQLKLEDFGIVPFAARRIVQPASPAASLAHCEVVVWREREAAYVLVRKAAEALPGGRVESPGS